MATYQSQYTGAQIDQAIGAALTPDTTLSQAGKVADAKAAGDAIANKVSKSLIQSANLFDKEDVVSGEFLVGIETRTAAGCAHTDWIFVRAGDYVTEGYYTSYGGNATNIQISLDGNTIYDRMSATFFPDSNIMKMTIVEDCYIRYNVKMSGIDTNMLVAGSLESDYPSSYVPYEKREIIESGVGLNDDMKNEIMTMSPLWQKKICADGDSISAGAGYAGGYAKIISEANNMVYQNISVGGGTIIAETYSGESPRHWICRSVPNLDSDSDFILIEGGVNDASLGVSLGTLSQGYDSVLDDTTFFGALETIFKYLVLNFTGKKYGFIIPHAMTSGMSFGGAYNDAVRSAASKWGIPLLDLSITVPPFGRFIGATYSTIISDYTYNGDGWHPTEKCYKEYYVPQITSWLESL